MELIQKIGQIHLFMKYYLIKLECKQCLKCIHFTIIKKHLLINY